MSEATELQAAAERLRRHYEAIKTSDTFADSPFYTGTLQWDEQGILEHENILSRAYLADHPADCDPEWPQRPQGPPVPARIGTTTVRPVYPLEDDHAELEAERDSLRAVRDSVIVGQYMRVVVKRYIDDEDAEDERDAIWDRMNQAEKDEANRLVVLVFRDHM